MKPVTTTRQKSLPQRTSEILHSIVHAYIDSGEPVASRTISRQGGASLSAATIRNIMADLSEEGFLSQPHTSAGRVPTAKAFRDYVHSLHISKNVSVEATRLRNEIRNLNTMEERVELSSHLLTQISHSMGIAAAIPSDNQVLDCVEFVSLSGRRVLMVVVTKDRMVRDKVVAVGGLGFGGGFGGFGINSTDKTNSNINSNTLTRQLGQPVTAAGITDGTSNITDGTSNTIVGLLLGRR